MADDMTVLNVRMKVEEKARIIERAKEKKQSASAYSRKILLSDNDDENNTNIIQEKDERIADLKNQIEDYKQQIEQLHTIVLVTQKDNQLLLELKSKKWWQFWK